MQKDEIIKNLNEIIEVTKGLIHADMDEEWNEPWLKEIEALNYAIEAIEENGKLKEKLTSALTTIADEASKKSKLAGEKQELIEALCLMIELARHHLVAANSYGAVNKAVELVRKHITKPVMKEAQS